LHKSHSLYGFFALLLGGPGTAARAATVLAASGVVCLLVRLLRGPLVPGTPPFAMQFSGLVVATVLLSPHLMTYDLTVLLLPMFILLVGVADPRRMHGSTQRWLVAILVMLYALPGISVTIASATRFQATAAVLLALLFVLVCHVSYVHSDVRR
jgi:hypothetical protein